MYSKDFLADVYKDFFNKNIDNSSKEIEEKENKDIPSIDNLFISDESKLLLKKIILYMEKYQEKGYISFNIIIEGNDKNTCDEIITILQYYANKYHYIDKNETKAISMYNIDTIDKISNLYEKNGILLFQDLIALKMNDHNFKMKFYHAFKEQLNQKKITIIFDEKEKINDFLLSDDRLETDYFGFRLTSIKPTINDVYNEILNKISGMDLHEDFSIKLLDYITESYNTSNLDYSSYVSNLYKYISFNNEVPKLEKAKSMDEVFKELNELVGLEKVKNTLNDLVDLITLKNKTKNELKINNVNLHMVFLGNPGTGKTTVARLIAEILYNLKYIKQNKLIEVSSKDLIAEYVGQTAVKTMNVINSALGGILFIDEAYSLASKNGDNSFNAECIATLIKAMEDYRDNLVVIFAGYTKEMQLFLDSNSGIVSRIGYTLEFDDYTNDELKQIFKNMVTKAGFILEESALDEVERLINENRNTKNFGNARFIRNVYEKTVINHASNTKNNKSKKILKTITKKDINY